MNSATCSGPTHSPTTDPCLLRWRDGLRTKAGPPAGERNGELRRSCARFEALGAISGAFPQPVLHCQLVDSRELPLVRGDEDVSERKGVRRDEEVVSPYRLTCSFELGTNLSVYRIRRCLEREDLQRA